MESTTKNPDKQRTMILKTKAGTLIGKRYLVREVRYGVICTKGSIGQLLCCGDTVKLKEANPLPSSD
jgi:hypothetical protein